MAIVKYSKRPDCTRSARFPGPYYGCHRDHQAAPLHCPPDPGHRRIGQRPRAGAIDGRRLGQEPLRQPDQAGPLPARRRLAGLANLLEAAKPGVDTRLDPTPSQITDRIEELLNRGANEEALSLIERREAAIKGQRGADVQLMFQHARALAALGRADEAIAVYSDMTTQFPELPEPWNNLAALYASRGELERAQDSLQMALRANPDYAAARANLGDIQLMMALRTYRQEEARGVPGMKARVEEIESLLKDKQPK